jgi:hypothetical protein
LFWVIDGPPVRNPSTPLRHIQTTQCSLPQVRCGKGANTFPSHNQYLILKFMIRPVHLGILVTLNKTTRWQFLDPVVMSRCAHTCDTLQCGGYLLQPQIKPCPNLFPHSEWDHSLGEVYTRTWWVRSDGDIG